MLDDKWEETLEKVRSTFEVEEELRGEIENIPRATFEGIVFESPLGRMKIIRSKRPKVLDKKTQFSGRTGSETSVEYIYSEDEYVDDLEVSKWNDGMQKWQKADMSF